MHVATVGNRRNQWLPGLPVVAMANDESPRFGCLTPFRGQPKQQPLMVAGQPTRGAGTDRAATAFDPIEPERYARGGLSTAGSRGPVDGQAGGGLAQCQSAPSLRPSGHPAGQCGRARRTPANVALSLGRSRALCGVPRHRRLPRGSAAGPCIRAPNSRPEGQGPVTSARSLRSLEVDRGASSPSHHPDGVGSARLWTQHNVAAYLSVSTRYVRGCTIPKLVLPGSGPRGLVRYDPNAVKAWAAQHVALRRFG